LRYFAELAYNGKHYHGWQAQPGQVSVQGTVSHALSTILNTPTEVVGCGRTDAGVHAKQYFLHFDHTAAALPDAFQQRLNKFLPKDIAVYRIFPVQANAHARFDATHRAYEYHIDFFKNPFGIGNRYYFPYPQPLNVEAMQEAAALLLQYERFYPFCKSNTDVKTMRCALRRANWTGSPPQGRMRFHIASDRFLRGMVRLIVGMCLNVGLQKLSLDTVKRAMDQQERLERSWSVPPDGLYLTDIRYPYVQSSNWAKK